MVESGWGDSGLVSIVDSEYDGECVWVCGQQLSMMKSWWRLWVLFGMVMVGRWVVIVSVYVDMVGEWKCQGCGSVSQSVA